MKAWEALKAFDEGQAVECRVGNEWYNAAAGFWFYTSTEFRLRPRYAAILANDNSARHLSSFALRGELIARALMDGERGVTIDKDSMTASMTIEAPVIEV